MKRTLKLIARLETGDDPDAVWSRIGEGDRPYVPREGAQRDPESGRYRYEDRVYKPLTTMTAAEVLAWQDDIDRYYPSEAAGAYQFLEDTLREFLRGRGDHVFDRKFQDSLALELMRRRGLGRLVRGQIDVCTFCNNLAMEWASLPVVTDTAGSSRNVKAGQSYYAGDGLNRAHCAPEELIEAVTADLREYAPGTDSALATKDEIMAAQRQLIALGYQPGVADGICGPATRSAVLSFQAYNGLETTGRIDDTFLARLSTAPAKPVSDARKKAKLRDIKGSKTAAAGARQMLAGGSFAGLGSLAFLEPYIPTSLYGVRDLAGFVSEHVFAFSVIAALVVMVMGGSLILHRLTEHRTGRRM